MPRAATTSGSGANAAWALGTWATTRLPRRDRGASSHHMARRPSYPLGPFMRRLSRAWVDDSLGDTAAALTYYGILSVFPGLLFVVALIGLMLGPISMASVLDALAYLAPRMSTNVVRERLVAIQQTSNMRLVVLGLVGTVIGTTFAVETLMRALNRCYEVRETRSFPRRWGLAIGTTILAGATGIAAIVVAFAGPLIAAHLDGGSAVLVRWARGPAAALLATTLWAFLYWALPNTRARFRLFTPGAVLGALSWVAASLALNAYVRSSRSYEVTYGALGGVVVILVWMWLSSAAILVGAEINKVVGDRPLADRKRASPRANNDGAVTSS